MIDKISLVKKLREMTHISFDLCKKALEESNYDIEKALQIIQSKGVKIANNRINSNADETIIAFDSNQDCFSMIQFACETDFVIRNEKYQNFIKTVLNAYLNSHKDLDNLLISFESLNIFNLPFSEAIKIISSTFGEKILVKNHFKVDLSYFYSYFYSHNNIANKYSKKVCFILSDKQNDLIKNICMHASFSKPLVFFEDELNNIEYDKLLPLNHLVLELQYFNVNGKEMLIKDFLKENDIFIKSYKFLF